MKKAKKLALNRETLRSLSAAQLGAAVGGLPNSLRCGNGRCSAIESGCNLSCEAVSCLEGAITGQCQSIYPCQTDNCTL